MRGPAGTCPPVEDYGLVERLAGVAVRVAHEAADMLVLAAPLPIPEWSVEMYAIELQGEMDAVLYEWPDMPGTQLRHLRQTAGTAFERRLAQLTCSAYLAGET